MLIAARESFAASRKRLPYDAEVEYLEGTGTQWIDTGYVPHVPITERYIADCTVPTFTANWQGWFGMNNGDAYRNVFFRNRTAANSWQTYIPKSDANWQTYSTRNYAAGTRMTIRIAQFWGNDICFITPQGETQFSLGSASKVSTASTTDLNLSFGLFSTNRGANARQMRFYSFAIQDYATNTPIMTLQPVRVGAVGYMYDEVSGRLIGNAGTGNFVLGPDK